MPENGKAKLTSEEFKLRILLETTLLVWVRTSLSLMGFGFVISRFGFFLREIAELGTMHLMPHPMLGMANSATGTILILMGVVVLLLSVFNHQRMVRMLERGDLSLPSRWSLGVVLGVMLAALGMCMATYLAIVGP